MNVYYPVEEIFTALNPYTATLINGIKAIDNNFSDEGGSALFWKDDVFNFEIIHFMWPDTVIDPRFFNYTVDDVKKRLDSIKLKDIKIVSTCHNIAPHYSNNSAKSKIYDLVYSYSDVIIHLGKYSFNKLHNIYPQAKHVIIYHHVYDQLYDFIPTKLESKELLGLDLSKKYILCLGAFRSDEERSIVKYIMNKYRDKGIEILAPSFSEVPKRKNIIAIRNDLYRYFYRKIKFNKIHMSMYPIEEKLIPYYCCACDMALIQRTKILNSGNLPMNLYFGNVVVGPNVGNVGELLNETGNPTFNILNLNTSLENAIEKGFKLTEEGQGKYNRDYAIKHFSTEIISRETLKIYKTLLNR